MPAPAKVSPDSLRAAARRVLERDGQQGLTMQAVATELGVRAPSLYKHLRDRDALVRLVAEDIAVEIGELMARVLADEADAADAVRAIAASARRYAREHPHGYGLIFGPLPEAARARGSAMERSSAAILEAARRLSGEARALESARTITAWMHGFTSMELAGAFRLGGSVDDAWSYGLDHLVHGLAAPA
ncbi:TetR/AcrR family transcriptional regulator [Agromyces kandeliae]|uniref:TetR family transcriptional regulator n=1 Tax=Agromyces kandeliae TaxID=2666141 RepID=A0A6L5QZM0_9MICO|nr:TetR/AcrR family transcriptional regulator [Agromyces kandeliae]MRX42638.1 TetR family transcriptional regulator [Agromyces kandeliae]